MNISKISAFALALTTVASLASCSDTKKSGADSSGISSTEDTTNAEIVPVSDFTTAFKAEDYSVPVKYSSFYVKDVLSDTDELILDVNYRDSDDFENMQYTLTQYRTDRALTKFTEIHIPKPEEALSADACNSMDYYNPDGSLFSIFVLEDHGGVKIPEVGYDENFDYDSYYANCTYSYLLVKYDKDMNIVSTANLEYPESFYNEWNDEPRCMYSAFGDRLLCCPEDGSVWSIGADGTFTQIMEAPENDLSGINYVEEYVSYMRDREGKLIACVPVTYKVTEADGYEYDATKISYCDTDENGKPLEPFYTEDGEGNSMQTYKPTAGYGDFRLLITCDDALYGITDSGERKEIINWMDSDTEAMEVIPLGNDEFIGLYYDRTSQFGDFKLKKLTRRDPAEFANVKLVTIGCTEGTYGLPIQSINEFNAAHSDYRIKVKEIKNDTDAASPLGMAMLKDEAPDVIYNVDISDFFTLRGKDAFADLDTYMEKDTTCNRDSFMPNIVKAMESPDGKLYGMPLSFGIETLVTRTDVNSKLNWSFDDMTALYDDPPIPSDKLYAYDTKEEMLQYMLRPMSGLIDYDKAECHFDSPDFIKMLEFCNRFVSEVDQPNKMDDPYAHQEWYAQKHYRLQNNEAIIEMLGLYTPNSFSEVKNLQAGGADITLAGFPSSDGKGGKLMPNTLICINAKANEKQGAWEVFKFLTGADHLGGQYEAGEGGFPTLKNKYEEYFKNDLSTKHTYNGIEAKSLTADEEKMIREFILNSDTLGTAYDDDMYGICLEEAESYFNGELTAEEAAEHIQNRISILVSERS